MIWNHQKSKDRTNNPPDGGFFDVIVTTINFW